MTKFLSHQKPLENRVFTFNQMHEVYRDLANKKQFPDFECWIENMIESGVFEILPDESEILDCSHYCPYIDDCRICPRNNLCEQEKKEYENN